MNGTQHIRPKVFVAGATGLTGRFVVASLSALGIPVIAHVRPDSPRLDEWTTRFEEMNAQVSTVSWALEALVAEFEAVTDPCLRLIGNDAQTCPARRWQL